MVLFFMFSNEVIAEDTEKDEQTECDDIYLVCIPYGQQHILKFFPYGGKILF